MSSMDELLRGQQHWGRTSPFSRLQSPLEQTLERIGSDTYLPDVNPATTFFLESSYAFCVFSPPIPALEPCTLLNIDELKQQDEMHVNEWIMESMEYMLEEDDVYTAEFCYRIYLNIGSRTSLSLSPEDLKRFKKCGVVQVCLIRLDDDANLPSGPYMVHEKDKSVYRCSRIFPDPCGAFMFGVIRDESSASTYHKFGGPGIPIPSRLYYGKPSAELPLAGKRFAVKDCIHIEGLPTSVSSKAYGSLHDDATPTAPMITSLIKLGAILVGKTKTSQFTSGESAIDWVDYQCPFNIRGDGTFAPYCSSTGSASAVAAYDWLDAGIGTDTLGSIIQPAFGHGIFGIRPTFRELDNNCYVPVSSQLYTTGALARNTSDLSLFTKGLLQDESSPEPKLGLSRILIPSQLIEQYGEKQHLANLFIKRFEQHFKLERSELDISSLWGAKHPDKVEDYLHTTLAHLQLYGSYHATERFRERYKNKKSREPYVNPMVRYKWDLGSKISTHDFGKALEQQIVFRQFLLERVFNENAILMFPANKPQLEYRDDDYYRPFEERAQELQGFGYNLHHCSFLGGLPEIVVPIGQYSVVSKTTGMKTHEPFCMSIIGWPGSDLELIEMLENVLPGDAMSVLTGETAFSTVD